MTDHSDKDKPIAIPDALKNGIYSDKITVEGIEISWNVQGGTCNFRGIPVAMMWVDSTLAGLMSGVQYMVGPERFNLALQAEGRKSVESDWLLISSYDDFAEGFAQLNLNAKVAGWGDWQLISYQADECRCVFRAYNNWEGGYQKALGVCWGSGMLAGKLAGICSKLFDTNCWATQTCFVAKGDEYDEFVVTPSNRNLEQEIEDLLNTDQATRADMAVALRQLQNTEKILRESEQRYDQLVKSIPIGIYTIEFSSTYSVRFTYVSPRFCDMLGVKADAILHDTRRAFTNIHRDDMQGLIKTSATARSTLQSFHWEGRFIINGKIRWMRFSSDLILSFDNSYLWHGIVSDITEQVKAEEQLHIAATAFESQEGTIVTDAQGYILRVNHAYCNTTGYSINELIGHKALFFDASRHNAEFYRAMWQYIRLNNGWQGEMWEKRKNGEMYPIWLTISLVKDKTGRISHYISTQFDITDRKKAENKINELAFFDQLTGLANRTLLFDRIHQAMAICVRHGNYGALLLVDLDNFKTLNDTLGHDMGDLLLKEVAQRLSQCVRAVDTVARLGGDEFVVMLVELPANSTEAAKAAELVGTKILLKLNQPYNIKQTLYNNTPSIGATLFCDQQIATDVLLKQADLAMYRSKAAGRNTLKFFNPEMESALIIKAKLENDLRKAIALNQLQLYYQGQYADNGALIGTEALVRWQHPERGMISPNEFIPLAEETGLIIALGQWVLKAACQQLVAWEEIPELAQVTIAVNVSARQFREHNFVHQVCVILEETGANPYRLKLELTESLLVHDVEEMIEKMSALQAKGISFSLDDFGTGYSSLAYLKRLPLNQLKIDQSFVRDVLIDTNDAVIAKAIATLAYSLGLEVIAEGVETIEQKDFLLLSGCNAFQGYLFCRPLPSNAFEKFSQKNSHNLN